MRAGIRTKLSGRTYTFEAACERLLGADERVSEGPSLLHDIQASNLAASATMRGLFANGPFDSLELVAVLGSSDRPDAEHDSRLWNRVGPCFYTEEDLLSSGWLVNSNQGKVVTGDDGKQYDQFYNTNCAFTTVRYCSMSVNGRRTWQHIAVVVTTQPVETGQEFVTHYTLPLRPSFQWAHRFAR
jgi:hypothetical protein